MGKRLGILGGVAVLAFLLAACSDPQADHRDALDAAIPNDLAFVDSSNASCIRTAIENEIGLDGLTQRGLDAEALAAGTADVGSLFADIDADAIALAYQCIDADQRYVDHFDEQLSISLERGCLTDEALRAETQAMTVLAAEEIVVGQPLRDVVRGCLSDDDFANLFGLDRPADLAAGLKVEPIGIEIADDEIRNCVGTTIVDSIGAERLNDAGISIAQPHPYDGASSLSDDEMDLVAAAMESCEAIQPMLVTKAIIDEPQAGECAIDKLNGELRVELLHSIRTDARRWKRGPFNSALDECIEDLLDERFGPEEPVSAEILAASRGYIIGATSDPSLPEANEYEEACMQRAVPLYFTDQGVDDLYRLGLGEDIELSQAAWDLAASTTNCIDSMKNLRAELAGLGFSENTIECIVEDLDPAEIALVYDVSLNGPEADPSLLADFYDALSEVEDRIDDCATVSELNRWNETVQTA